MPHAVRVHAYGGPDVLRFDDIEAVKPGPGEVRLKQTAIGVNFIDTYHRTGLYPLPALPAIIGMEGVGIVEELGDGVADLKAGDRVAYASALGAYADHRLAPADRLVKIPATILDETAAAMMLQGMTVRYLFLETYRVTPDTVLLFHAAAGGVGLIACQWARVIGATMIGTVLC